MVFLVRCAKILVYYYSLCRCEVKYILVAATLTAAGTPRPSRPSSPPFIAIPLRYRVERYRLKDRFHFGAPGSWVLKLWVPGLVNYVFQLSSIAY